MENTRRQSALFLALSCAFVAALLFIRISAFGIWDPWELTSADAARHLLAGEATKTPTTFSTWLVSLGFKLFGVHEWAGRTPIALCGLLTTVLGFLLVSRYANARVGMYAAFIAGTSPLFIMNSRAMLGEAPSFAVQTAIAYCAMGAVLPSTTSRAAGAASRILWLIPLFALLVLAVTTRGALLCALPPLAAVAIVALLVRDERITDTRLTTWLLVVTTVALALLIGRDVWNDSPELSMWTGGRALSSTPPTFDAIFEEVFHAFAPWSALLPLAVALLWRRSTDAAERDPDELAVIEDETPLVLVALVWAVLGYGAQTLFMSRYGGEVTYLPIVALATLVALFVAQIERRGGSFWSIGIAAAFLIGLVLRDYALYPSGAVAGLPLPSFDVPKVFNPKREWSLLLGAFGATALLGFGADSQAQLALKAPYHFLREQWQRGIAYKLWLIAVALILIALAVFGALAYAMPQKLGLPTVGIKWVRRLVFVAPAVPIGLLAGQIALYLFGKLGRLRFVPMLVAGAAIGVYASQGYLPALSEHFSPREVYDSYNRLAKPGEPLGEYRVGGRAAAYYADGEVIELSSVTALVDHLAVKTRRWVAFPADELANLDRAYRKRSGEHIVVADARSARVLLGTNQPLAGKHDQSFLQAHVRKSPPAKIQFPAQVNFDDRIELLGYDLVLPHKGYVGAGESFKIIWYFRCKRPVTGDYKVFLHIDGMGQRIHGDHETVDGLYPVRMWDEGDVIFDEHELDVPSSYQGGQYTINLGFYSGESRLPITSGPNDGENRARVGVLRIQ